IHNDADRILKDRPPNRRRSLECFFRLRKIVELGRGSQSQVEPGLGSVDTLRANWSELVQLEFGVAPREYLGLVGCRGPALNFAVLDLLDFDSGFGDQLRERIVNLIGPPRRCLQACDRHRGKYRRQKKNSDECSSFHIVYCSSSLSLPKKELTGRNSLQRGAGFEPRLEGECFIVERLVGRPGADAPKSPGSRVGDWFPLLRRNRNQARIENAVAPVHAG